jgi:hypothetical protein
MEQQQTNCQEEGKQKCSNVLNLTSTHFLVWPEPFDSKDGKSNNKQKEDEKKRQKICGSLSQLVILSSTTYSFSNKDDERGKRNQKDIQVLWKLVPTSF